jgi:hypothetical protein
MNLIDLYKDAISELEKFFKEAHKPTELKKYFKKTGRLSILDYKKILQWLQTENSKQNRTESSDSDIKLRWLGTPSQFGFIFNELAERGFIEIPKTHGKESISKFANICYALFEIDATPGNLAKELNPNKCTLSNTNRKFFKFPNITDL